jgi:hypothetical protein
MAAGWSSHSSVASGTTEFQMFLVDGPNHETIRCNDKRTVTF